MRLLKVGRAVFTASLFALLSGLTSGAYGYAADTLNMELASTASGSAFAHTSLLADTAPVAQFSTNGRLAERTRIAPVRESASRTISASALTPPPSTTALAAQTTTVAFDRAGDQGPSAWLMGGVIVLLICYQLRRTHRLLRPHRFHEL